MKKYNLLLFNILFILFMDICFKLLAFSNIFNIPTLYMILSDIVIAIVITILETLFEKTANKIICLIITVFFSLLIIAQYVYFLYYDAIFSIYSLFHGAQVFGFIDSIMEVMLENILSILLLIIPLVVYFIIFKRLNFEKKNYKFHLISLLISIIIYIIFILLLNISDKDKTYSSYNLYFNTHVPKLAVRDFGVLTEMRLDLKRTLFGFDEKIIIEPPKNNTSEFEPVVEEEKFHKMDIDFDSLIENESSSTLRSMHEYFKNISPTPTRCIMKDFSLLIFILLCIMLVLLMASMYLLHRYSLKMALGVCQHLEIITFLLHMVTYLKN